MRARRSGAGAPRRLAVPLAAAGLFALATTFLAASLWQTPPTAAPGPGGISLPIGEVDMAQNWSDPASSPYEQAERLVVTVGTTAGYMQAGDWTDLCAHVGTSAARDFAGAVVSFEVSAGRLRDPAAVTAGDGWACTRFQAPGGAGQVVVVAEATDGESLRGGAENRIEVYGAASTGGLDPAFLLAAVLCAMSGAAIAATLGGPRSAHQKRLRAGRALLAGGLVLAVAALLADVAAVPSSTESTGHEHGQAVVAGDDLEGARSSTAVALAIGGAAAVAVGLPLAHRKMARRAGGPALLAALALLYLDGVVHWMAVSGHANHPLEGAFFLAVGAAQVTVALLAPRRLTVLWGVGIWLTASLVLLYFATRLYSNPFGGSLEPFEALGVLSKVTEGALVALLGYVLIRHRGLLSTTPRAFLEKRTAGPLSGD